MDGVRPRKQHGSKAISRITNDINKDVDLVISDLLGNLCFVAIVQIKKMLGVGFDPPPVFTGVIETMGIVEDLESLALMLSEHRAHEMTGGMVVKVRGEITNTQTPSLVDSSTPSRVAGSSGMITNSQAQLLRFAAGRLSHDLHGDWQRGCLRHIQRARSAGIEFFSHPGGNRPMSTDSSRGR